MTTTGTSADTLKLSRRVKMWVSSCKVTHLCPSSICADPHCRLSRRFIGRCSRRDYHRWPISRECWYDKGVSFYWGASSGRFGYWYHWQEVGNRRGRNYWCGSNHQWHLRDHCHTETVLSKSAYHRMAPWRGTARLQFRSNKLTLTRRTFFYLEQRVVAIFDQQKALMSAMNCPSVRIGLL